SLPNLPIRRLFGLPNGISGLRIGLTLDWAPELEWASGEKKAWHVSNGTDSADEIRLKQAAARALNVAITAVGASGDAIYAGSADGLLWASLDKGATWSMPWGNVEAGPVEAIFVD